MASISTNEYSYDGAKFKVNVIYSYSAGSFTWHWKLIVSDGKFDSKHTITAYWVGADGQEKTQVSGSKHNDTWESTVNHNHAASTLKVWFKVGGKTTNKLKIEKSYTASPPNIFKISKVNDSRYNMEISGSGYAGSPITHLTIERATDSSSSWSSIGEGIDLNASGSYTESYVDDTTEAGHKYQWRVKATNRSGDSAYTYSDAQYTSPETSADMDVEEGSGFNTVVWSVDSVADIDRGIIQGWYVRRSENGGAYQTIGTVYASASQYNYSYVDYDISNGSTYKYDIQSFGQGGQAHESQQGGSEIQTAPSKPISVKAYKNENDYVVINIVDSSSNTADKVLIERSIDGGDYSQIAEVDFPCDTYTDETAVGSDTIKYRVRNHNSKGYSAYTESNSVLLKSKPNPPSLMTPYNNTIQDVVSQPIRLVWMHNATDGSPQRQAEIKVTVDGVSQTYTATTQSYVEIAGFDINDSVEWTVRTKGSHADFSDWSAPYTFRVLKKPEILILSPLNSEVITTLPIVLEWLYNDLSGELKELSITLIKDNDEVAKYNADPTTSEYSLAGFLFENHSVYGIRVDALSTTGLKASQLISVAIEYEPISLEGGLLPTIVTDEETGFAYITIGRDITEESGVIPEPIEIAQAYLYRVHDKERVLLGEVNDGSQIIDKYAPFNVYFEYELLQLTVDGRISLVSVTVNLPSSESFIYFRNGEIFKGKWNPKVDKELDRPEMVEKRYSGREYPLIYDSKAKAENDSYSCVLVDRKEYVQLLDLMRSGHGRGIWKSVFGDSYDAKFKVRLNTNKYYHNQTWEVSLDITRIEKDGK